MNTTRLQFTTAAALEHHIHIIRTAQAQASQVQTTRIYKKKG